MQKILKIENLKAESGGKEILNGLDFEMNKGDFFVLLGPNASGKSTLSQVIMGSPKYKIKEGKITFLGKDITRFSPEKRARLGISLSWQAPPAVKGVRLSKLLEKISRKKHEISEGKDLLEREVNVNFSGGERKIAELLQIFSLDPKLVILDEIDSGLDIRKLQTVSQMIKKGLIAKGVSVLMITHSGHILNYLKPDRVLVILGGRIICSDKNYKTILKTIKKYGYEKCKECKICHK